MHHLPVLSVTQVRSLCIINLSCLSPRYAAYASSTCLFPRSAAWASSTCLVCSPGTQPIHNLPVLSVPQVLSLCFIYLSCLFHRYAAYASLTCLVCHPGTQRMHYLPVLFVTQVRSLCITYLSVPQVRNLDIIYLSCLFPRYAAYAPSTCLVCSPGTQRMYHLPVLIVCPLGTDPVHHLLALRRGSHGDCVAAAGPHQTGQRIVRGRPEVVP